MRHRHGEGALTDLGSQCFDLWRRFTGAEVDELWCRQIDGARKEEVATVNARLSNGVLATGVFSTRTTHQIQIAITGAAGRLQIDAERFDGLEWLPFGSVPGSVSRRLANLKSFPRRLAFGRDASRFGGMYMDSIAQQWNHFEQVIRGAQAPYCGLEDGLRALEITKAAQESSGPGTPVRPAARVEMWSQPG